MRRSLIDFWPPFISTASSEGTRMRPNDVCRPARSMRSFKALWTLFSMPEYTLTTYQRLLIRRPYFQPSNRPYSIHSMPLSSTHINSPTIATKANTMPVIWVVSLRVGQETRSEEHTSELQSLMRISYAVFCLKKKKNQNTTNNNNNNSHQQQY